MLQELDRRDLHRDLRRCERLRPWLPCAGESTRFRVASLRRSARPAAPALAPANTSYSIAGGEPYDPDDYTEQNSACPHARVFATGPCRVSANVVCGGVGDVFDFDIRTLAGPGTCVVEATVTDPWGAVGRDTLTFGVAAP